MNNCSIATCDASEPVCYLRSEKYEILPVFLALNLQHRSKTSSELISLLFGCHGRVMIPPSIPDLPENLTMKVPLNIIEYF
ncbi:hypothetical protein S83_020584 [Arachis hypogaea]